MEPPLIIVLGEGGNEESWPVDERQSDNDEPNAAFNFAPRGSSRFQDRVRNKLPRPLDLGTHQGGQFMENLYNACSV